MLEVTIQFVETVTFLVTEVMVTKRMISVTHLVVLSTLCVDKKRNIVSILKKIKEEETRTKAIHS